MFPGHRLLHSWVTESLVDAYFQFLVFCVFPVGGEGTKVVDVHEESEMTVHVPNTPPQKKIKVEMASPGNMSDVLSLSSCESVEPIELPLFTPMVKCALRYGDCNSTI